MDSIRRDMAVLKNFPDTGITLEILLPLTERVRDEFVVVLLLFFFPVPFRTCFLVGCVTGTVCVVRAMDRCICVGGTGCVQRVVIAQSAGPVQKVDHLLSRPVYTGAHTACRRGMCAYVHCLALFRTLVRTLSPKARASCLCARVCRCARRHRPPQASRTACLSRGRPLLRLTPWTQPPSLTCRAKRVLADVLLCR